MQVLITCYFSILTKVISSIKRYMFWFLFTVASNAIQVTLAEVYSRE